MTIRYYLIPGILSCLLITAGVANAQRGGGGHGGGGHAGGGHAGGAHMGAAHTGGAAHYGAAHYNGAHYGGTRIIYGGGYYGGLGYGGLYGYGYGSPYLYGGGLYNYGYGGSSLYSSPQYSYYSAPQAPIVQDAPPVETPKNAQVKVLVPTEDAKVWFDGNPTTSTGTERIYHTPDLSPTATNSYRIRASWVANGKQVVQEQVITVAPGRGTIVDFTRPLPESVAPPPKE